jgi:biopolymer transport protein ExbD
VIRERLAAIVAEPGVVPELRLRADRGTHFERVTETLAIAQGVGISRIAFVTAGGDEGEGDR